MVIKYVIANSHFSLLERRGVLLLFLFWFSPVLIFSEKTSYVKYVCKLGCINNIVMDDQYVC